jgi:DNA-binding MarR family transcriptional regulator
MPDTRLDESPVARPAPSDPPPPTAVAVRGADKSAEPEHSTPDAADRGHIAPVEADRSSMSAAAAAMRALTLAIEHWRGAVAEHLGVDMSATMAMSHLSASGALTPRQLAAKTSLTPSTMTALLDRLEGAGYARRSAHPTDRRKTVVQITEHGHLALTRLRQRIHAALGVFDDQRLPEVAAIMTHLATALNAQAADIHTQPSARTSRRDSPT